MVLVDSGGQASRLECGVLIWSPTIRFEHDSYGTVLPY